MHNHMQVYCFMNPYLSQMVTSMDSLSEIQNDSKFYRCIWEDVANILFHYPVPPGFHDFFFVIFAIKMTDFVVVISKNL